MKTFEITGWYRYGDNEKDFEVEAFKTETPTEAISLFNNIFKDRRFFSINVKEII